MVSEDKKRKNRDDKGWYYGGVKRRDFKASKDGPEVTGPAKPMTSKEKKKYCKRQGYQQHVVDFVSKGFYSTLKCIYCGKEYMSGFNKKYWVYSSQEMKEQFEEAKRESWWL